MVKRYPVKRKQSRHCTIASAWMFGFVLLTAPWIVLGDSTPKAIELGAFGLHPDIVKGGFLLLMGIVSFFLIRTLRLQTRSLNALHSNDREFARVLTEIVTMHRMNHAGQIIAPPKLSIGNEEGE